MNTRSLAIISLLCIYTSQGASLNTPSCPSEQEQFELIFHLFAPFHQGSQKPLAALRKTVQGRTVAGETYNQAFSIEVERFLTAQLVDAFTIISKLQGVALDQEIIKTLATQVIDEKFKKPFKHAHQKELFEQDPRTLPAHIFTYVTTPYFVETYKNRPLPEINRFDIESVMFYLHSLRIGLNMAGQIITYSQKILDDLGVPAE